MVNVKLNVVGGKHAGQSIPLTQKKFLIGREQDCQLRPNSELVSRHHCIFSVDDFSVRLRDLGSTNGTLVNGEQIRKETTLKAGDRVVVGSLEFEVQIDTVPAGQVPAAEPLKEDSDTVVAAGSETLTEMKPIEAGQAAENADNQLASPPAAPPAEAPQQQPPAAPAPLLDSGPPPSTGDTTVIAQPTMMPGQPYQPMMPQMGYPQMYGGYPYPGMPPQQMPMYPQPGYPAYPQQMPHQQMAPPQEAPAAAAAPVQGRDVSLPDPSETGVKDAPAASEPSSGEAAPQSSGDKSNNSAASIIQQHMQKRPGG